MEYMAMLVCAPSAKICNRENFKKTGKNQENRQLRTSENKATTIKL